MSKNNIYEQEKANAQKIITNYNLQHAIDLNAYPIFEQDDFASLDQVLRGESLWRSDSEASHRLTNVFKQYVNPSEFSIPVSSGTAGLHTVISYFVRHKGRFILMSAYTWYSVAASVINSGGIPIFYDIAFQSVKMETPDLGISPSEIGCCVVSHLFGVPAVDDKALEWLRSNDIPIVEDCAQCIRGKISAYDNVGGIGVAAIYSFNGSKHIPAGEGGMIATDNPDIAAFANNFIMTVDSPRELQIHRFNSASEGWNYRLGAISASLAASLIPKTEKNASRIYRNGYRLASYLTKFPFVNFVENVAEQNERMWLGFPIYIDSKRNYDYSLRNTLYFLLRYAGYPCSVWVDLPIPETELLQKFYNANPSAKQTDTWPGAKYASEHLLILSGLQGLDESNLSLLEKVFLSFTEEMSLNMSEVI